jgi:hypothetical protein
MAKLRVRAAVSAIAAGILITIGGCSEQAPTSNSVPESGAQYQLIELKQAAPEGAAFDGIEMRAEKVIGAEGGTLEIPGGHTLAFPAGALKEPTRIRARIDARYVEVDLGPEGIQFPAGAEPSLTLNYGNAANAAFSTLAVGYFSESGRLLEVLRTDNNTVSKSLTVRLRHFSRYVAIGS